jgi:hypothetical protein
MRFYYHKALTDKVTNIAPDNFFNKFAFIKYDGQHGVCEPLNNKFSNFPFKVSKSLSTHDKIFYSNANSISYMNRDFKQSIGDQRYTPQDLTDFKIADTKDIILATTTAKDLISINIHNMKISAVSSSIVSFCNSEDYIYALTADDDLKIYEIDAKNNIKFIKRIGKFTRLQDAEKIKTTKLYLTDSAIYSYVLKDKMLNIYTKAILPQYIKSIDLSTKEFNYDSLEILYSDILKMEHLNDICDVGIYHIPSKSVIKQVGFEYPVTTSSLTDTHVYVGMEYKYKNSEGEDQYLHCIGIQKWKN